MDRFHVIEDGAVILRRGRRYQQQKVYRRAEQVFVRIGVWFLRLTRNGGTTDPDISWLDVEGDGLVIEHGKEPRWVAPDDQAARAA